MLSYSFSEFFIYHWLHENAFLFTPYRHAEVILTAAEKESFSVNQVIPDSQKSKEIGYCKQGLDNDSYDNRVNFEFF